MRLYHFTSSEHLRYIKQNGLSRGDVPITPHEIGDNAVWLTVDSSSKRQGWSRAGFFDKTEVRITVNIDEADSRLVKWSEYAKQKGVKDWWFKALDGSAGGGSGNWYLFFGTIMPAELKVIEKTQFAVVEKEQYENLRL